MATMRQSSSTPGRLLGGTGFGMSEMQSAPNQGSQGSHITIQGPTLVERQTSKIQITGLVVRRSVRNVRMNCPVVCWRLCKALNGLSTIEVQPTMPWLKASPLQAAKTIQTASKQKRTWRKRGQNAASRRQLTQMRGILAGGVLSVIVVHSRRLGTVRPR